MTGKKFIDVKQPINKENEFYIGVIAPFPKFKSYLGRLNLSFQAFQQHNKQITISHDSFDKNQELRYLNYFGIIEY